MPVRRLYQPKLPASMALLCFAGVLPAHSQLLPVMPPTATSPPSPSAAPVSPTTGTPTNTTAPLAAVSSAATQPGERPHAAEVTCQNGQLEIHAENSSLNSILRAVSRCTGMHITGGVSEQRVFGNYGPAAPATVLATLIDGTGSNMLLKETAADQPAELILTPRTGGPTPPPPASYAENDTPYQGNAPSAPQPLYPGQQPPYNVPARRGMTRPGLPPNGMQPGMQSDMANGQNNGQPQNSNQTPVPPPAQGSMVTSPPSIPQPTNNVNGSPNNTSYTAGTYPTTDSRPLDSVATPSTTPSTNGIVDAPNPPPAGSDTAAVLNGAPQGTPGTTNINPNATSQTTTPGATNTTLPANTTNQQNSGQPNTDLTPEQIFAQLQQRQQQQQQRQQQQNNPTQQDQTQQNNPQ